MTVGPNQSAATNSRPTVGSSVAGNGLARAGSLLLLLTNLSLGAGAHATPVALPGAVMMNPDAGRGGWLVVMLRLGSGEAVPCMVETGSPITVLDKSLEEKLGARLETIGMWYAATGMQEAGIHAAPQLFLGGTPLATGAYIATCNLKALSPSAGQRILGILGLDCLRHYCIQLDFTAGEMRFLDSGSLNEAELGRAFGLTFSTQGQKFPPIFSEASQNEALPFIHHTGLCGGTITNLLVDTGDNVDGVVEKGAIKGHWATRFAHWLFPARALRLRKCVWDDQTYTRLKVGTARERNHLGLRFLARHLVTLDFPRHAMFLKRTSAGPLDTKPSR